MTGELKRALDLAEITANPGRHRGPLYQPRHLLFVQPVRTDSLALSCDAAEEWTMHETTELDPRLDSRYRAGGIG